MSCGRKLGPFDCCSVVQGDCLELMKQLPEGGVSAVITDPPYGIGWKRSANPRRNSKAHTGIANDHDTSARDVMIEMCHCPVIVFGSFYAAYPQGVKQVLVWHKPADSGVVGSTTGFRRDVEPVFLVGNWPVRAVERSSVLRSFSGGIAAIVTETGHPHTKPVDVMEELVDWSGAQTVLDPFCGSGTTLVAAKKLGRHFLGFEISEEYCQIARARLSAVEAQPSLFTATPEQSPLIF